MSSNEPKRRARKVRVTRPSVRVAEKVARTLITLGGVLTVIAVATICVFLVAMTAPLMRNARVEPSMRAAAAETAPPRASGTDEYGRLAWTLAADGTIEWRRLDDGTRLGARALVEAPRAVAHDPESRSVTFGFDSGEVRTAHVEFVSSTFGVEQAAPADLALRPDERRVDGERLVERLDATQWRVSELSTRLEPAVAVEPDAPPAAVLLVDQARSSRGEVLAAWTADGRLTVASVQRTVNLLTDEETLELERCAIDYPQGLESPPVALALLGGGDSVVLLWRDGYCVRFDVRDFAAPIKAEAIDLLPEEHVELTAVNFLVGRRTLVVGDSLGRIRGWFRAKPQDAGTVDGTRLVAGHDFGARGSAVTALAASVTTRTFVAGFADGAVRLYYMTSGEELGQAPALEGEAILTLALAPHGDMLAARTARSAASWELELAHPEVSAAALFRPVWYESYAKPEHTWQSSSGTDDFEPKFGLVPLIFGTLKATLYSMLFGVPLALLAAVFSSEFLAPRARMTIKSGIEIMASLPSVVLGFLAAIVIAPAVQGSIATVLTCFYAVPTTLLLGAHLWQLVPQSLTLRLGSLQRFVVIGSSLIVGVLAGVLCAPLLERWLFAGDVAAWLDGRRGSAFGGWVFLTLPLAAALVAFGFGRIVSPWVRNTTTTWSRASCARFALLRFSVGVGATLAISVAVAALLDGTGFDPRGELVDTYVQRNALVVGFLMGFAIVPIVYTLAEDALSSVPEHLRLASLGAGATPWQTAVRVIVPTAMSGLFSAVMVGLGRAVGETMIVLMAAGNTPLMEWNVFNGFRTLSANIAVELPEAVEGSTHYRMLFLAALCLFAMTFVVNTLAEIVRQRFRRRAYQL